MKVFKISKYPWYQELVSLCSFIFIIAEAWLYWDELPAKMVSKIGSTGEPQGFASPLQNILIVLFVLVVLAAVDTGVRYAWLLSEKGKKFNALQLLSTPVILLAPWSWHFLVQYNVSATREIRWYLPELLFAVALVILYLLVTEKQRSVSIKEQEAASALTHARDWSQLPQTFCVVIKECPRWWTLVVLGAAGLCFLGACSTPLWAVLWGRIVVTIPIIAGFILLSFAAGFRYVVYAGGVDIHLGILNLKLRKIAVAEILNARVMEYAALSDFGGWGLRYGKDNTTAFLLSGTKGLLLETKKGNILLSMKEPENIAQLISVRLLGQ